jgi:hypothetical protein
MSPRERRAWLWRALGQATAAVAFSVALIELLRREGVVRLDVFSGRLVPGFAVAWVVIALFRSLREHAIAE